MDKTVMVGVKTKSGTGGILEGTTRFKERNRFLKEIISR